MTSSKILADGTSEKQLLDSLSPGAREAFEAAQITIRYPEGAVLFAAGETPAGALVLRTGEVNLSGSTGTGKFRKVSAGGILGLGATVSGEPHDLTAVTTVPTEVAFIAREHLLTFLRNYPDAAFKVVQLLSSHVWEAMEQARSARSARSHRPKLRAPTA